MKLSMFNNAPKVPSGLSPALEEMVNGGLLDENDIDYLNHIKMDVSEDNYDVAMEGFIRAVGHDVVSNISDTYRTIKGYFLGINSKREYIEEICDDLIEWCEDKKHSYPNLELKMGPFKTWMKTSEVWWWRYFFLLNDDTYKRMIEKMKNNTSSELEKMGHNEAARTVGGNLFPYMALAWFVGELFNEQKAKEVASEKIDHAKNIDELIKVVKLYKERNNNFFKVILDRKLNITNTPFQMLLLGATDLRRSVKKTINLAI